MHPTDDDPVILEVRMIGFVTFKRGCGQCQPYSLQNHKMNLELLGYLRPVSLIVMRKLQ